VYKRFVNPDARLLLVGKYHPDEAYIKLLDDLLKELDISDVYFCGHVTLEELIAYYRVADVLLCLSEHEGFCVPAVESFYFQVPVLAYNCTALPYTLGDAGILINKKRYDEIAEMIHLVVENTPVREAIIQKQTTRLEYFHKERIVATLLEYLRSDVS
jgi:glycosyltransferase involved in cell wall biosynthesis